MDSDGKGTKIQIGSRPTLGPRPHQRASTSTSQNSEFASSSQPTDATVSAIFNPPVTTITTTSTTTSKPTSTSTASTEDTSSIHDWGDDQALTAYYKSFDLFEVFKDEVEDVAIAQTAKALRKYEFLESSTND